MAFYPPPPFFRNTPFSARDGVNGGRRRDEKKGWEKRRSVEICWKKKVFVKKSPRRGRRLHCCSNMFSGKKRREFSLFSRKKRNRNDVNLLFRQVAVDAPARKKEEGSVVGGK